MTSTIVQHVDLDRISEQAREVRPGEMARSGGERVLTIIASVLFGMGWLAYKTCAAVWLAAAWTWVAVREGWREARNASVARRAT